MTRADVGWFARNVLFRFVLRREVADKEAMERHLAATDPDWTVVRVGTLTNATARGSFRVADVPLDPWHGENCPCGRGGIHAGPAAK
jgi:NAD(P)H-binding